MKPAPMTDEQIESLVNWKRNPTGDQYDVYFNRIEFSRAIIAARDTQWEQMLAYRERHGFEILAALELK